MTPVTEKDFNYADGENEEVLLVKFETQEDLDWLAGMARTLVESEEHTSRDYTTSNAIEDGRTMFYWHKEVDGTFGCVSPGYYFGRYIQHRRVVQPLEVRMLLAIERLKDGQ